MVAYTLTRLSRSSIHTTPTSWTRICAACANKSISVSKNQPVFRTRGSTSASASRPATCAQPLSLLPARTCHRTQVPKRLGGGRQAQRTATRARDATSVSLRPALPASRAGETTLGASEYWILGDVAPSHRYHILGEIAPRHPSYTLRPTILQTRWNRPCSRTACRGRGNARRGCGPAWTGRAK